MKLGDRILFDHDVSTQRNDIVDVTDSNRSSKSFIFYIVVGILTSTSLLSLLLFLIVRLNTLAICIISITDNTLKLSFRSRYFSKYVIRGIRARS